MTATADRLLFWTPRVLAILFAGFLGIFAADVFDETQGFWSTAIALLLHLVPSGLIVLILVIAWRHEWLGGLFYFAISLLFVLTGSSDWIAYVAISGPLALIALLFFVHWGLSRRSQLQQRPSS